MVTRISSFATAFTLSLVCLLQPAAAITAGKAEFSVTAEAEPEQLAARPNHYEKAGSRNINERAQSSMQVAQNTDGTNDASPDASRQRLHDELQRIRRSNEKEKDSPFNPPLPTRRKSGLPASSASDNATSDAPRAASRAIAPEVDQLLGQLLLVYFKGSQPTDPGPRAVRSLLQSGQIAGVVFSSENIASKSQLKEMMKFLWPGGANGRPIFATSEAGGEQGTLPALKDFERWPSQHTVAAKGDAQYAYSTYQSLASNLSVLGFNMNFGPSLLPASKGQQSNSFGSNPLQAGVFAKTFILGHRDSGVLPVPIIDESDLAIRALKTLLVSYPETPVAFTPGKQDQIPFVQSSGIVKGARFCFIGLEGGQEEGHAAQYFNQGCDILVLKAGADSPASAREHVAQAVSEAIAKGELSMGQLTASAHRLSALRSSIAARDNGNAIKSAYAH
jgi:hypothetical protein